MDTPIPVDLGRIAQDLQIRRVQVESVVQLLDEGNTVPFITRYRKERTGGLNELVIREIQVRVGRMRELAERKETILKAVEAQGKLTEELAAAIRSADNPKRLEDLYLPYKPKKKTKASDAREKGLEPLALRIWNRDETLADLPAAAAEFVNAEKGLETAEKVLEGVGHILAEAVSELAVVRDVVRRVVWKTGKVVTTKAENVPETEGLDFRDYFNYSEPIGHIPPHRVLAINRGDKEGPLKVKLDVPRQELERAVLSQLPLDGHPHADVFAKAAIDALDRLLMPSMEREVRRDLTEMAERHAVDVFARNLRSLLLQPPIGRQVVLAIDPGFRTGCKIAVLDSFGNMLDHGVIHPHPPQNRRHEAKLFLKDLVAKHQVDVVAIGNGTAGRETEELIAEIISEGTHFHQNPDQALPEASPAAEASAEPMAPLAEPAPPAVPAEPTDSAAVPASTGQEAGATPETAAAAQAETPAPSEPKSDETPAADENGSTGEGRVTDPASVETMPPITGGAPDEETETPPSESGEGTPAPPASSTPEANHPEHQADQADLLEKSDETRNPAREPETPADSTAPPSSEAPANQGQSEGPPSPASETPIDTVPPPAPEAASAGPEPTPKVEDQPAPTLAAETSPADPDSAAAPAAADQASPASTAPSTAGKAAVTPAPDFQRPPKAPKTEQQPKAPKVKQPPPPPKPHPADAKLSQLAYVIVNEAGASVYSTSPVGREEFPDFDATLRSAISIGRRLQDPLAELVKIEPQNIGVGLYQHDVNPKQLKESLDTVIESCVNFVGVDLNTASVPLLRHVSGLNALTARRLVERRQQQGPFSARSQLLEVEGVGPATFTQAAGFLKIRDEAHPFDRTWIHPESYPIAEKLLESFGLTPEVILHKDQMPALHAKLNEADLPTLARDLGTGEPTLRDIFDALARPERDPREDLPKPIFKKGVLKLEDLSAGMELKGTVLNVVDFGAFVDIGLKDSGLVHISQLANRYIKSPHDVVSVGDVVTIWVMGVDQERKRVSLTMVQPGTERPRGAPGGRRGGSQPQQQQQQGEGRPQGGPPSGERRSGGPGRGPRREGSGAPGGEGGGPAPSRGGRPSGRSQQSGPGRVGPRPLGGDRRLERAQAPRPAKPAPPPPPLSKDAITGSVPLRSFGQLKQLFEMRGQSDEGGSGDAQEPAQSQTQTAQKTEPTPAPEPQTEPQQGSSSDPQPQTP